MRKRGVTVAIPTLPHRGDMLSDALKSIREQIVPPDGVVIEPDNLREGAWVTRNRAMAQVDTEWTAFLDDDDLFLPHHIQFLTDMAVEHELDFCWGWYYVIGGVDPFPFHRGKQYDPNSAHIFPIAVLARTEMLHTALKEMGGFQPDPGNMGNWGIQDQPVWDHLIVNQGARHMAFDEITWKWRHHGHNTSGLPGR